MSATLAQIFALNPTTTIGNNDLLYIVQSPYTPGTDAGILGSDFKALFAPAIGSTSITTLGTITTGTWHGTTIDVAHGGTGNTTFTAFSVICAGTTATGLFQNVSGVGSLGQVLTSNGAGALPTWQANAASGSVSPGLINQLAWYAANGSTVSGLTTANDGTLITSAGGVPSISSTLPSTVQGNITSLGTITSGIWHGTAIDETHGGTNQTTYILGDTLYSSAANTLSKLSGNSTSVKQYLSQTGTGAVSAAPAWATISGADITGAALTKTDDTNVTLTLGGTPTTALLRASSLALGWTGQLSLARGGTNANLTADNGAILYSTSSALGLLAHTNTSGLALLSGNNTAPSWSLSAPITRINIQVITTTSTYTPTSGSKYAIIEGVGGGGGSGGVTGTGGVTCGNSGGGGGGGYFRAIFDITQIGTTAAVVIGAGGAGGAAGVNNGVSGGNTTFTPTGTGGVITANGGSFSVGVAGSATVAFSNGGQGGSASGAAILGISGSDGTAGITINANVGIPGNGGSAPIIGVSGNTINATGFNPAGYGTGGPGTTSWTNGVNRGGATGQPGVIIVTEFISI